MMLAYLVLLIECVFMKEFVLLLGCIFGFMYVSAQTIFRDLTFEEALNQAGVEGKCVLVDCYTSWCGPCKMMAERYCHYKK